MLLINVSILYSLFIYVFNSIHSYLKVIKDDKRSEAKNMSLNQSTLQDDTMNGTGDKV